MERNQERRPDQTPPSGIREVFVPGVERRPAMGMWPILGADGKTYTVSYSAGRVTVEQGAFQFDCDINPTARDLLDAVVSNGGWQTNPRINQIARWNDNPKHIARHLNERVARLTGNRLPRILSAFPGELAKLGIQGVAVAHPDYTPEELLNRVQSRTADVLLAYANQQGRVIKRNETSVTEQVPGYTTMHLLSPDATTDEYITDLGLADASLMREKLGIDSSALMIITRNSHPQTRHAQCRFLSPKQHLLTNLLLQGYPLHGSELDMTPQQLTDAIVDLHAKLPRKIVQSIRIGDDRHIYVIAGTEQHVSRYITEQARRYCATITADRLDHIPLRPLYPDKALFLVPPEETIAQRPVLLLHDVETETNTAAVVLASPATHAVLERLLQSPAAGVRLSQLKRDMPTMTGAIMQKAVEQLRTTLCQLAIDRHVTVQLTQLHGDTQVAMLQVDPVKKQPLAPPRVTFIATPDVHHHTYARVINPTSAEHATLPITRREYVLLKQTITHIKSGTPITPQEKQKINRQFWHHIGNQAIIP